MSLSQLRKVALIFQDKQIIIYIVKEKEKNNLIMSQYAVKVFTKSRTDLYIFLEIACKIGIEINFIRLVNQNKMIHNNIHLIFNCYYKVYYSVQVFKDKSNI